MLGGQDRRASAQVGGQSPHVARGHIPRNPLAIDIVDDGEVTGDVIAVQVKGGESFRCSPRAVSVLAIAAVASSPPDAWEARRSIAQDGISASD